MSRVEYLRLSTALPILVPLPLSILFFITGMWGFEFPDWIGFVVMTSFWAVLMFGYAYSILAGTVLLVLWKRSWKAHVIAALVAPVLMIPVIGVSMWVRGGTDALAAALDFAPYCLGLGYTYVAAALVGMWVLISIDRIKDENPV